MPHLTFPISPDGCALQILIGLHGKEMAALYAAGKPIPNPVWVRGLVDSGTDITCVAPRVMHQLGLVIAGSTSTQTAGGSVNVNLFDVSLTITDPAKPSTHTLVREHLVIMELLHALPTFEALIGMDVLAQCLLILDGPGQQFTLAF